MFDEQQRRSSHSLSYKSIIARALLASFRRSFAPLPPLHNTGSRRTHAGHDVLLWQQRIDYQKARRRNLLKTPAIVVVVGLDVVVVVVCEKNDIFCSVFYILCNEEPLWMQLCLHQHQGGVLQFQNSWRHSTLLK